MFGLFNKKAEKQEQDSPEFLALVEKWEGFLKKIEARFDESLGYAEEAILENLVASDYDMGPTMTAWGGIKSQLRGLADKIEKTFNEKVQPQMLEYKERYDLIDEDQKGVQMAESFYPRIERFELILEGKVAKIFYDHAMGFLNEEFHCTQCGGQLQVSKNIFRSHYVSCDYCNTVNTFTPNDKVAQLHWTVENIAKLKALKEWDEKNEAREKCKDFRSLSEEEDKTELKAAYEVWEEKEKAFWTKYYTERSTFIPEYQKTLDHDVDVKMNLFFYDDRMRSDLKY